MPHRLHVKLSIATILTHEVGVHYLKEFVSRRNWEAELYFWLACESFRGVVDIEDQRLLAHAIWQVHLKEDAEMYISLDTAVLEEIEGMLMATTAPSKRELFIHNRRHRSRSRSPHRSRSNSPSASNGSSRGSSKKNSAKKKKKKSSKKKNKKKAGEVSPAGARKGRSRSPAPVGRSLRDLKYSPSKGTLNKKKLKKSKTGSLKKKSKNSLKKKKSSLKTKKKSKKKNNKSSASSSQSSTPSASRGASPKRRGERGSISVHQGEPAAELGEQGGEPGEGAVAGATTSTSNAMVHAHMFDAAQEQVLREGIIGKIAPRFYKSPEYQSMLDDMTTDLNAAMVAPANMDEPGIVPLEDLLRSPVGAQLFRHFLVGEKQEHQLDFYLSVNSFTQRQLSLDERIRDAKFIYRRFLHPDKADRPIVPDSDELRRLLPVSALRAPSQHEFEPIIEIVMRRLEEDLYPRLLRSDLYRKAADVILHHSYEAAVSGSSSRYQAASSPSSRRKRLSKNRARMLARGGGSGSGRSLRTASGGQLIRPSMSTEELERSYVEVLEQGELFIKHCRFAKPHRRFVFCDTQFGVLYWVRPPPDMEDVSRADLRADAKSLLLVDVQSLKEGKQTPILHKSDPETVLSKFCFSILTDQRSLDLQTFSTGHRGMWLNALTFIIKRCKEAVRRGVPIAEYNRELAKIADSVLSAANAQGDNDDELHKRGKSDGSADNSRLTLTSSADANLPGDGNGSTVPGVRRHRLHQSVVWDAAAAEAMFAAHAGTRAEDDLANEAKRQQEKQAQQQGDDTYDHEHTAEQLMAQQEEDRRLGRNRGLKRRTLDKMKSFFFNSLNAKSSNVSDSTQALLADGKRNSNHGASSVEDDGYLPPQPADVIDTDSVPQRQRTLPVQKSSERLNELANDGGADDSKEAAEAKHAAADDGAGVRRVHSHPVKTIRANSRDKLETMLKQHMQRSERLGSVSLKEGWLNKRGEGFLRLWQRRYFVLSHGKLKYFADRDAPAPSGTINLTDILHVHFYRDKDKGTRFELECEGGRVYALSAATRQHAREWAVAISNSVLHNADVRGPERMDADDDDDDGAGGSGGPVRGSANTRPIPHSRTLEHISSAVAHHPLDLALMRSQETIVDDDGTVRRVGSVRRSGRSGKHNNSSSGGSNGSGADAKKPKPIARSQTMRLGLTSDTFAGSMPAEKTKRKSINQVHDFLASRNSLRQRVTSLQSEFLHLAKTAHAASHESLFSHLVLPASGSNESILHFLLEVAIAPHVGATSLSAPRGLEGGLVVLKCSHKGCRRSRRPGSDYCVTHQIEEAKRSEAEQKQKESAEQKIPKQVLLQFKETVHTWMWSERAIDAIVASIVEDPVSMHLSVPVLWLTLHLKYNNSIGHTCSKSQFFSHSYVARTAVLRTMDAATRRDLLQMAQGDDGGSNRSNNEWETIETPRAPDTDRSHTSTQSSSAHGEEIPHHVQDRRASVTVAFKSLLANMFGRTASANASSSSVFARADTNSSQPQSRAGSARNFLSRQGTGEFGYFGLENEDTDLDDETLNDMNCKACFKSAKEFAKSMVRECSAHAFNVRVNKMLLFVLLTEPERLMRQTAKLIVFGQPVQNPLAWYAFFAAMRGSRFDVRLKALEDLNAMLVTSNYNRDTILKQYGWQEWLIPLLYDVSPDTSKATREEMDVYRYTMNAVVLLCARAFFLSDRFFNALLTTMRVFQSTWDDQPMALPHIRILLRTIVTELNTRKSRQFFPADKETLPWRNLLRLCRAMKMFVFSSPAQSKTQGAKLVHQRTAKFRRSGGKTATKVARTRSPLGFLFGHGSGRGGSVDAADGALGQGAFDDENVAHKRKGLLSYEVDLGSDSSDSDSDTDSDSDAQYERDHQPAVRGANTDLEVFGDDSIMDLSAMGAAAVAAAGHGSGSGVAAGAGDNVDDVEHKLVIGAEEGAETSSSDDDDEDVEDIAVKRQLLGSSSMRSGKKKTKGSVRSKSAGRIGPRRTQSLGGKKSVPKLKISSKHKGKKKKKKQAGTLTKKARTVKKKKTKATKSSAKVKGKLRKSRTITGTTTATATKNKKNKKVNKAAIQSKTLKPSKSRGKLSRSAAAADAAAAMAAASPAAATRTRGRSRSPKLRGHKKQVSISEPRKVLRPSVAEGHKAATAAARKKAMHRRQMSTTVRIGDTLSHGLHWSKGKCSDRELLEKTLLLCTKLSPYEGLPLDDYLHMQPNVSPEEKSFLRQLDAEIAFFQQAVWFIDLMEVGVKMLGPEEQASVVADFVGTLSPVSRAKMLMRMSYRTELARAAALVPSHTHTLVRVRNKLSERFGISSDSATNTPR